MSEKLPNGFQRLGMAYSSDQITVRLGAINAVSEISSLHDGEASFRLWLSYSPHPVCVRYGARSAAKHDRDQLMAALQREAAA